MNKQNYQINDVVWFRELKTGCVNYGTITDISEKEDPEAEIYYNATDLDAPECDVTCFRPFSQLYRSATDAINAIHGKNTNNIQIRNEPFSIQEIKDLKNENNFVSGIVKISLGDVIHNDFEEFMDLIAEKLVGVPLLMQIEYTVVGTDDQMLLMLVTGDVTEIINANEE